MEEIHQSFWVKNAPKFFRNKSVVLQLLTCSDHFILQQYTDFLKKLNSCWALTAATPSNTDTWSGVPSHVTGQQDSWGLSAPAVAPSEASWGLPAPAPAVAPSEASWGGDDWSSEDESVRDTRLMPPPPAAGGPAVSRQPPQLQQAGQRVLYANNYHTARWDSQVFIAYFQFVFPLKLP